MTSIETRPKILNFYSSPIGKKIITGVTGLVLTLFVIFHVTGNLLLLVDPTAYNQLGHFLESWGLLLYFIEAILIAAAIFHIIIGVMLTLQNRKARSIKYNKNQSAGFPSKQSLSSRTMIISGAILLIFLISHLLTFKFGQCDSTIINGIKMRDLSQLVTETFHKPIYTIAYSGVMIFLGLHLRHGIWSGLQSLSIVNSRWSSQLYWISSLVAFLTTLGFIAIPTIIYVSYLINQ